MITIDIDKFLIDCEYINFFMQIHMQWSKDDGSTSPYQTLITNCLPCFEKLNIFTNPDIYWTETMSQCFVCNNFQKTVLIRSTEVKCFVGIIHMLRIHIGLRKLSKTNVYDFHLKKWIHWISLNYALRLQVFNCYLNNNECLLTGTNMTLRFEMMMK